MAYQANLTTDNPRDPASKVRQPNLLLIQRLIPEEESFTLQTFVIPVPIPCERYRSYSLLRRGSRASVRKTRLPLAPCNRCILKPKFSRESPPRCQLRNLPLTILLLSRPSRKNDPM